MILTAQHMGDAHFGIVHRIAEKKGWRSVGAPHHEIADVAGIEALRAADQILEHDRLSDGHPEAQRRRLPCRQTPGGLIRGERRAAAVIPWRPARGELRPSLLGQRLGRAKAGIKPSLRLQGGEMGSVETLAP